MVRLGHLEIIIVGKDILAKQFGDFQTIRECAEPPKPKIFHAKTVGQDRMQIQFKLHKGKLQPSREILPLV
jgi:hypothetical protein